MGRNSQNWSKKEEMARKAEEHTQLMSKKYSNEIKRCIQSSEVIRDIDPASPSGSPEISVIEKDSVGAVFEYEGNITVLNFASYKNPGGAFLNGAIAQEESLCHESFLYNVLCGFDGYYEYNKKNLKKGLYTNAAIYSPEVIFERNGKTKKANVITCAAPNNSLGIRYKSFTPEENTEVLKSRIQFVRDIAEKKSCDVLILGAFGCGVFAQNTEEVAALFKSAFEKSDIQKIVYAVPGGKNLEGFKKIFKEKR